VQPRYKVVVVEAIRRCAALGATVAYVGATLPIYKSVGFRQIHREARWVRVWPVGGSRLRRGAKSVVERGPGA